MPKPEEKPQLHAVEDAPVKKNPNEDKINWTQLVIVSVVTAAATWGVTHTLDRMAERRQEKKKQKELEEARENDGLDDYGTLSSWPGTDRHDDTSDDDGMPPSLRELNTRVDTLRNDLDARFQDMERSLARRMQRLRGERPQR